MREYVLLMQKMSEDAPVTDSLEDFEIVCTDVPFEVFGETKDLPSRDFPDEDGEDVFIPNELPIKPYDMKIGMAYKGGLGTCYTKIKNFVNYLTGKDGSGASLKIYSKYTGIGRQNVYCKSMSEPNFGKSNSDEVLTFDVTFRITDPVTDIILSK